MVKSIHLFAVAAGMFLFACSGDDEVKKITPPPTPPPVVTPQASLQKLWETEAVFKVPESIILNPEENVLYVSNINGNISSKDGNGFISKVATNGTVEKLEWITGLDGPKGLGIFNNHLYVADITNVKVIDITTETIVETIELPGAIFLNDLVVDEDGIVYISDSDADIIFKIENSEGEVWMNTGLNGPNGLLVDGANLFFVEYGSGKFYSADKESKVLELISSGFAEGDGLIKVEDKEWLISGFNGVVNFLDDKTKTLLLDTKATETNAADIAYLSSEKLVLVPTAFKNTIAGYKLKK